MSVSRTTWECVRKDDLDKLSSKTDIDSIVVVASCLSAFKITGLFKIRTLPFTWTKCQNIKMLHELCNDRGPAAASSQNFATAANTDRRRTPSKDNMFYEITLGQNNGFTLSALLEIHNRDVDGTHRVSAGRYLRCDYNAADAVFGGRARLVFLKTVLQPILLELPSRSQTRLFSCAFSLNVDDDDENINHTFCIHESDWIRFAEKVPGHVGAFANKLRASEIGMLRLASIHYVISVHGQQYSIETARYQLANIIRSSDGGALSKQVLCQIHKATTIMPGHGNACFLSFDDGRTAAENEQPAAVAAAAEVHRDTSNACVEDQEGIIPLSTRARPIGLPLRNVFTKEARPYYPYGLLNAGHLTSKGVMCNVRFLDGSGVQKAASRFVTYIQCYDPSIHIVKLSSGHDKALPRECLSFVLLFLFGGFRYCDKYKRLVSMISSRLCEIAEFLKAVETEVRLRVELVYTLPNTEHPLVEDVICFRGADNLYDCTNNTIIDPVMRNILENLVMYDGLVVCNRGWTNYVSTSASQLFSFIKWEINSVFPIETSTNMRHNLRDLFGHLDDGRRTPDNLPMEQDDDYDAEANRRQTILERSPHLAYNKTCTQTVYDSENLLLKWLYGDTNRNMHNNLDYGRMKYLEQCGHVIVRSARIMKFIVSVEEEEQQQQQQQLMRQQEWNAAVGVLPTFHIQGIHESRHKLQRLTMIQNNGRLTSFKTILMYDCANYDPDKVRLMDDRAIGMAAVYFNRFNASWVDLGTVMVKLWMNQSNVARTELTSFEDESEADIMFNGIEAQCERLVQMKAVFMDLMGRITNQTSAESAFKLVRLRHFQEDNCHENRRKHNAIASEPASVAQVVDDLLCHNDISKITRERSGSRRTTNASSAVGNKNILSQLILSAAVVDPHNVQFRNLLVSFVTRHVEIYKFGNLRSEKWQIVQSTIYNDRAYRMASRDLQNAFKISNVVMRQAGVSVQLSTDWQRELVAVIRDSPEAKLNVDSVVPYVTLTLLFIVLEAMTPAYRDANFDMSDADQYCRKHKITMACLRRLGLLILDDEVTQGGQRRRGPSSPRFVLHRYCLKPFLTELLAESWKHREDARGINQRNGDDRPYALSPTRVVETPSRRTSRERIIIHSDIQLESDNHQQLEQRRERTMDDDIVSNGAPIPSETEQEIVREVMRRREERYSREENLRRRGGDESVGSNSSEETPHSWLYRD